MHFRRVNEKLSSLHLSQLSLNAAVVLALSFLSFKVNQSSLKVPASISFLFHSIILVNSVSKMIGEFRYNSVLDSLRPLDSFRLLMSTKVSSKILQQLVDRPSDHFALQRRELRVPRALRPLRQSSSADSPAVSKVPADCRRLLAGCDLPMGLHWMLIIQNFIRKNWILKNGWKCRNGAGR